MAITMKKVQEHAGELREMIAKRHQELGEKSGADQPPAADGKPPSRQR
jgi:hypothetical protein